MRESLSELICDDLNELAFLGSDVVASEEAIRVMLELDKDNKRLPNLLFIHKKDLQVYLKGKMANIAFRHTAAHYQFLVEIGARSKAKQGEPDTIHYCGIDLYIRAGKAPLAFVADHYKGHNGYYLEFADIAKNLGIQFIVPGGSYYQVDSSHCPIFTYNHLLLSAKDNTLLPLLESIIGVSVSPVITFNWNQLPAAYLVFSQSVSMLLESVDAIKKREQGPKDTASPALLASPFSDKLVVPPAATGKPAAASASPAASAPAAVNKPAVTGELISAFSVNFPRSAFANSVHRALFSYADTDPLNKDHKKVRSKAIKYSAAEIAGTIVVALEKKKPYTEAQLIDICYKDAYPLVHALLKKALAVQTKVAANKAQEEAHPLFKLAFSNAGILEHCLKNPKFLEIFNNANLLDLMQMGCLDPNKLFAKLIVITNQAGCDKALCSQVAYNLGCIDILLKAGMDFKTVKAEDLSLVLFSTKSVVFCKNPALVNLLVSGAIPFSMIEKIIPHTIEPKFAVMGIAQKIQYLREKFDSKNNVKPVIAPADDEEDDLFFMPDAPLAAKPAGNAKEAPVNIAVLVQSMSRSIFQPPVASAAPMGSAAAPVEDAAPKLVGINCLG